VIPVTPLRGPEPVDLFEYAAVIEIDADHCKIGFGCPGFLLDVNHSVATDFRNSEPLSMGGFLQDYFCLLGLPFEVLGGLINVVFNQVVAKQHTNKFFLGKII
jgi:hypothetical protein